MKNSNLRMYLVTILLAFQGIAMGQMVTPEAVTFGRDGIHLRGYFYHAIDFGGNPVATVILLNGFPGNEFDVLGLGEQFALSGMNALTFNRSGCFKSEGKASWENEQKDIAAAYRFLKKSENAVRLRIDTARLILGGWCNGGAMALAYTAGHPDVVHVFAITPSDPTVFMGLYLTNPEIKQATDENFAKFSYPNGHVHLADGGLQAIAEAGVDQINPIFNLKKNAPLLADRSILLIGGWNDVQTTMEVMILPLYRALQKAGASNIRVETLQDGHYFTKTRQQLANLVIGWSKEQMEH
jgi:pimeloyl-ACP methyl ester carboxylesterase